MGEAEARRRQALALKKELELPSLRRGGGRDPGSTVLLWEMGWAWSWEVGGVRLRGGESRKARSGRLAGWAGHFAAILPVAVIGAR